MPISAKAFLRDITLSWAANRLRLVPENLRFPHAVDRAMMART
jgi:hypothetical protein